MIKQNVIQFHCVSFPSQVASLAVSFQKLFLWIKRVQLLVLNVCTYFLSNQYEAVVFFEVKVSHETSVFLRENETKTFTFMKVLM